MKNLLVTVACIALFGCHYDPHASNYTTFEPSLEEIVGEYELDRIYMENYSAGIGANVSKLPSPPTIRLLADGAFIAERFPYFSEARAGFEYKFEEFRSLNAKWSRTTVGSIGDGSGSTKSHYGILVEGLPTHLGSFGFTGVTKVDGLIIGFGDPDSGDAIMFRKKTTESDKSGD